MMQPLIFILSYIVYFVGVDGFVTLPHFNLWKFSQSRGESPHEPSSHFSFISYTSPEAPFRSPVQQTAHYGRPSKSSSSSSSGSSSHSTTSPGTDSSNSIPFGTSPVKIEALKGVVDVIEKNYGKGSIQKLGEAKSMNVETTSSGSITLDMALGGGYPRGRVVEIFGPESSGKTTLALHAIAEVQKTGGTAAFIDAEHALDPLYAKKLGVNCDDLFVCQPDSGEMALDVVDQLVRSSAVDIIVVDSVAALVPRAELEGDMLDVQMGLQARLMSKALRKITGSLSRSQATVIFINQLRSKIGIMFGNPEVTAGGNALKFYSSVRVDVRRKELLKDNEGIKVKVKVAKNKVAPPFRTVEFDISFGNGIDRYGCLLDAAERCRIVERKGAWYQYQDLKLGQGKRAASEFLQGNATCMNEIDGLVRKAIAVQKSRSSSSEDGDYIDDGSEMNEDDSMEIENL